MNSLSNSFNPNKRLKEEFVSNLSGSSMLEIVALTIKIPILAIIRHSIGSSSGSGASLKKNDDAVAGSKNLKGYLATLSLDFLVIVVPMLLFFTLLADWTYIWGILFTLFILFCIASKRSGSLSLCSKEEAKSLRVYLSSYRIIVMIITCLCILAVDFRIFPRRYAKTETYGTSLMDIGVGAFVLANALVSWQARNIASVNWKTTMQSTSPLIILGFIRLVTMTGVDYQIGLIFLGSL